MNAQEFKKKLLEIIEKDFPTFVDETWIDEDSSFCAWADMFIAWIELDSTEACEDCYDENGEEQYVE